MPDDLSQLPQRRGHHPVLPPRLGTHPGAIDQTLLGIFKETPITDVSDAVGRLYTMSSRLRPLYSPMRRVIGTALTVKAPPGDNWAIHGALRLAFPGSVLVIDWRTTSDSCGAGVSALLPAIDLGLTGVIIDGAWRDIPEIEAIDFPVIATGNSPFSPTKNEIGEINVPVSCGGVVVNAGDLVLGDDEGIVVVPREYVETVSDRMTVHHVIQSPEGTGADDNQDTVLKIADEYWAQFDAEGGQRP